MIKLASPVIRNNANPAVNDLNQSEIHAQKMLSVVCHYLLLSISLAQNYLAAASGGGGDFDERSSGGDAAQTGHECLYRRRKRLPA